MSEQKYLPMKTTSGVTLAISLPDQSAITIAGVSLFNLHQLLVKKSDLSSPLLTTKPDDMPEEIWKWMKSSGLASQPSPEEQAREVQDILGNMQRLAICMIAGVIADDGELHPARATMSPQSNYDLDVSALTPEDLNYIWDLARSAGQQDAGNKAEAIKMMLAGRGKLSLFCQISVYKRTAAEILGIKNPFLAAELNDVVAIMMRLEHWNG